jgi:hypothetical protein
MCGCTARTAKQGSGLSLRLNWRRIRALMSVSYGRYGPSSRCTSADASLVASLLARRGKLNR